MPVLKFSLQEMVPFRLTLPDGKTYEMRRFDRRDRVAWIQLLDDEREEKSVGDLTVEQRAQMRRAHPIVPMTNADLDLRIYTIEGTGHVFRTCAEKSGVPADLIARIVDDGEGIHEQDLQSIALMLAGVADPMEVARQLGMPTGEEKDEKAARDREDAADPLASTGGDSTSPLTSGRTASPATPSSPPPTPGETRGDSLTPPGSPRSKRPRAESGAPAAGG